MTVRLTAWVSVAGLAVGGFASTAQAAPNVCFASWSEASPVVAEQRLIAVAELSQLARKRLDGEIVRTQLCVENGRYIYKVVVRYANGAMKPHTLDARTPFTP
jgi:uncharacterized membrane protein YkoI